MAGTRPIRYHRPPGWTRPLGVGDYNDDNSGMDLWGDTSTPVDPITVEYTPPPQVDVQPFDNFIPFEPLIAPSTPLFDPTGWNTTPATPNIPSSPPSAAAPNPIATFLKKLITPTGQARAPAGGGASSGGALPPPKLQPSKPLTPASGLAANPALEMGLGLVALVFGAALLSGHHDRRPARRRR